jgi:hypothetical protein
MVKIGSVTLYLQTRIIKFGQKKKVFGLLKKSSSPSFRDIEDLVFMQIWLLLVSPSSNNIFDYKMQMLLRNKITFVLQQLIN